MPDKMEREIEEILNGLEGSEPEEDEPEPVRGPSFDWAANLQRANVSRLGGISLRKIMLASLVLVALVGAGLFFGLVYPSLGDSDTSAGSAGEESVGEGVGHEIGEADDVDDVWSEDAIDESSGEDEGESHDGADRRSEDHEEHHGGGGDHH